MILRNEVYHMNKFKTYVSILLLAGMLFSCDKGNDSSSSPIQPSDGSSSSSSIVIKTVYWNETVDELLIETIGEKGLETLPVFTADHYSGRNSVDSSSGTNFTSLYCYKENTDGSEAKAYAAGLTAMGFMSQSSNVGYIRYKEISDTAYLVVAFVQGDGKDNYALGISAYLSNYRYSSWPEEQIKRYMGLSNIPHPEGSYYYFQSNNDGSAYINIEGLPSSCITDYIQLLEGSGYLVDYYVYSVVIYQAVDQGNTHTISFYYDSDTGMMALRIIKNS